MKVLVGHRLWMYCFAEYAAETVVEIVVLSFAREADAAETAVEEVVIA